MKLIKINTDHYVIVDDSEIRDGDWYLTFQNNEIIGEPRKCEDSSYSFIHCKKITHSTEPLELLSENGLSGMGFRKIRPLNIFEVKELIGEVDVEEKAEELTKHLTFPHERKEGIIIGYTQALEDNKHKKYTRNEVHGLMCKAFIQGWKKADVVEAGLEGLETDVECAWILTRHDSAPKTEWEVEFVDGKIKLFRNIQQQ